MNPFTNAKIVAKNFDANEYRKQNAKRGEAGYVMSRSDLFDFAKCPSKWRDGASAEEDSESLEFGSLVDLLLTQPALAKLRIILRPATYPAPESKKKDAEIVQKPWNGNSDWCQKWLDDHKDLVVVSQKELDRANTAVDRIKRDGELGEFVKCSDCQVYITAQYVDRVTGIVVPLKFLPDLAPKSENPRFGKCLGDLKTSADASHTSYSRSIFKYGYHWQGAMNLDAYTAATGEDRVDFRHVIVENFAPFQTARRFLSSEFIELGRNQYKAALALYARCLAAGDWMDYDSLETGRMSLNGWTAADPEPFMVNA